MASYTELIIWKKGIELSVQIYSLTKKFPKEELFSITNQMRRASISVPANIAEGWSRNSDKSFRHYLNIAKGSLAEVNTFLTIAEKLKYAAYEECIALKLEVDVLSKMIYKMQIRLTSDENISYAR
jgi:four helix bundle protein